MNTTILKTSNGYALTGAYTDALGRDREVEFYFDERGIRIGGFTSSGVPLAATAWRDMAKMMGLPIKARKMRRWLKNRDTILDAGHMEVYA